MFPDLDWINCRTFLLLWERRNLPSHMIWQVILYLTIDTASHILIAETTLNQFQVLFFETVTFCSVLENAKCPIYL